MSKSVKIVVFCAMCIALASVTSMIKVFEFPTGGSITLCSTLFAVLPGYFFGPVVGIAAGFAYGILQFFLGPYILTPVQVFIDYGLRTVGIFRFPEVRASEGIPDSLRRALVLRLSLRLDLFRRICLGRLERGGLFRRL